jgi:glycosyltransferase involved in cell wall biosynthesis
LGPKRAFGIGIERCTTDYIALCDQDDIWEPEKIAKQFKTLEGNKYANLCFHDLKLIDQKGNYIGKSYWEMALEPLPVTGSRARKRLVDCLNPVPGCAMFFSSDLKKHIIPMPPSKWICHDWWICVVTFFFDDPISINETLTKYRLHPNQTAGIRINLTGYALCSTDRNIWCYGASLGFFVSIAIILLHEGKRDVNSFALSPSIRSSSFFSLIIVIFLDGRYFNQATMTVAIDTQGIASMIWIEMPAFSITPTGGNSRMYLTPAKSNSVNKVSDPIPDNETIMTKISFRAGNFKARFGYIGIFLRAAHEMFRNGEVVIYHPHNNMPKELLDAFITDNHGP